MLLSAVAPGLASAAADEPVRKSGYVLGPDLYGSSDLAFPQLKIDLKPGFCAGLVASGADGLRFPRAIVQIPGRTLFVVADMGGWGHADSRLLLLDPACA